MNDSSYSLVIWNYQLWKFNGAFSNCNAWSLKKSDPCAYAVTLALAYASMHSHTYTDVNSRKRTPVLTHTHAWIQPRICTRTCDYKFMNVRTQPHTRSCMDAHLVAYLRTHTHAVTCTHAHSCTHTHACTLGRNTLCLLVHAHFYAHTYYADSWTHSRARRFATPTSARTVAHAHLRTNTRAYSRTFVHVDSPRRLTNALSCTCTRACILVHTHLYMCAWKLVYAHPCTGSCEHTFIYALLHILTLTHSRTSVHTEDEKTHTRTCAQTHTHARRITYEHTHCACMTQIYQCVWATMRNLY